MNTCPNCGKMAGLHGSILPGCMCQYSMQAPPQRKPLSDEMRKQMKERWDSMQMRGAFADGWMSSEAAHGIKE